MKLYLLSQTAVGGYDTYDSAVVAAKNEEEARNTHPSTTGTRTVVNGEWWSYGSRDIYSDWAKPADVTVEYLGETKHPAGVICASFNAG